MTSHSNLSYIERSIIDSESDIRIRRRGLSIYRALVKLPIIDPHTHYPSKQIAANESWQDPTMLFLGVPGHGFDHYLARLMLAEGIPPRKVYGIDSLGSTLPDKEQNRERFDYIVTALEKNPLNPSAQWFRIALEEVFDLQIDILRSNSEKIWEHVSTALSHDNFKPCAILEDANIELALTTDDPTDSLEEHIKHHTSTSTFKMLPTWRADAALYIENHGRYDFDSWLQALEKVTESKINSLQDLLNALDKRMDHFSSAGCIASDIGIPNFIDHACSFETAAAILKKRLSQTPLTQLEIEQWQSFMLHHLSFQNAKRGWVQFFHQGPFRDTNSKTFSTYGPDTGGDCPGEVINRSAFIHFLDSLYTKECPSSPTGTGLAKSIFFPINSIDFEFVLDSISGFSGNANTLPSTLQLGPPWWFNDTVKKNAEVIGLIADRGSLGTWIGMLSDARSLPSIIARIKQFRAVLAVEISRRSLHESEDFTLGLAEKVAHHNIRNFLGVANG